MTVSVEAPELPVARARSKPIETDRQRLGNVGVTVGLGRCLGGGSARPGREKGGGTAGANRNKGPGPRAGAGPLSPGALGSGRPGGEIVWGGGAGGPPREAGRPGGGSRPRPAIRRHSPRSAAS